MVADQRLGDRQPAFKIWACVGRVLRPRDGIAMLNGAKALDPLNDFSPNKRAWTLGFLLARRRGNSGGRFRYFAAGRTQDGFFFSTEARHQYRDLLSQSASKHAVDFIVCPRVA